MRHDGGTSAGVCGRNAAHSTQRCVEAICRVRTPKDFADVLAAQADQGPNVLESFVAVVKAYDEWSYELARCDRTTIDAYEARDRGSAFG